VAEHGEEVVFSSIGVGKLLGAPPLKLLDALQSQERANRRDQ
jgi:hypothetical protein